MSSLAMRHSPDVRNAGVNEETHVAQSHRYRNNFRKRFAMSKVWLITGSSRGLGCAIAQVVLEVAKSHIIVFSIRPAPVREEG